MQRMDLTKTATTTMTTTTGAAVSPPSLKSRSVLVMIMAMAVLHLMLFPSEKDATVFCQAFAPMARRRQHYNHYSLSSYSNVATITTTTTKSPIRVGLAASATASSSSTRNSSSSKNPLTPLFRQLPWNVRKEQERESRRLMKERNELFRQLGIVEDATYEEIVLATDNLIAAAGNDLKQKVKIEMAKDQILQLRLQERIIAAGGGGGVTGSNLGGIMSGSSSSMAITKEARAQSNFEQGYVISCESFFFVGVWVCGCVSSHGLVFFNLFFASSLFLIFSHCHYHHCWFCLPIIISVATPDTYTLTHGVSCCHCLVVRMDLHGRRHRHRRHHRCHHLILLFCITPILSQHSVPKKKTKSPVKRLWTMLGHHHNGHKDWSSNQMRNIYNTNQNYGVV